MSAPCLTEERLLRYVDRDLSAQDAAAVDAHVARCALCRSQVAALSAVVSELRRPALVDFDAAQHARAVLERLDHAAAASGKPRRLWIWSTAALICAAGVLLASRAGLTPVGTWQARGGAHTASVGRDVGVQLYEAAPSLRALLPNAAIRPASPLTAGYRNLGTRPAYLLLFAVDLAGAVHWIAPAYTQPGTDPSAVLIAPDPDEQLLPHTVQLEDLRPGALHVLTVISRSPAHVSDIEALEPLGVSAQRITNALPEAEVRELRLQVAEVQP